MDKTTGDFTQHTNWGPEQEAACRAIVRLAVQEDLDRAHDLTTLALVDPEAHARAEIACRAPGVVAGLAGVEVLLDELHADATVDECLDDSSHVEPGQIAGILRGTTRDLLTAERLVLNFVSRLSGIATTTREYVRRTAGTRATIYDTRKTLPGYRYLEKYAVRCGGGRNHRTGLFDAVLIKDNHLAACGLSDRPEEAIRRARQRLPEMIEGPEMPLLEIEVDTLDQFDRVLGESPDMILLDNFSVEQLREAVSRRDSAGSRTQLEASGGIHLETVAGVAATGVDRISVGALTHAAVSLDLGLDWTMGSS